MGALCLVVNPALAHVAANTSPPNSDTTPIRLAGETPRAVTNGQAALVRAHDTSAAVSINISLPLRNLPELQSFIANQASQGVYLTQDQFATEFGPTAQQVQAVEQWGSDSGLQTTYASPDGATLTLRGSVAAVSGAVNVHINDYRLADGRTFFANDRDPSVPAFLGVGAIDGLDSIVRFHALASRSRSVRGGGYIPADFRAAYDVAGHSAGNTPLDGTGQTIGFTLWGAPLPDSDLAAFATATGERQIASNTATYPNADQIQWINENGGSSQHDAWVETAMDVEYAHGMAPHAALKYFLGDETCLGNQCGGDTVGLEDAIAAAAADPSIHMVSNSWGGDEAATDGTNQLADTDTYNMQQSFMHAVAVGTTFYFSTGDSGADSGGTSLPSYPADSQYVVAVGGTTLSTSGTTAYSSEAAWGGSGTGCSAIFARPAWQTVAANRGSFGSCAGGRQVPDVAADGDPNSGAYVYFNGSSGQWGGTSLAAPLFTGMMAAANRYASLTGHNPVGWTAPTIYNCGSNVIAGCSGSLHDVTSGSISTYTAGPGFDQASGWGSIDWWQYVQKTVGANAGGPTPTNTAIGPTGTFTSTPTNTPVVPTNTPVPPTSTPTSGGGCSTDHICLTGLTASAASAAPGTQVALTATTAQSVGPTRWYIDIADQSGTVVQSCASGTSCVAQVSSGVAATRTYTAWLSTSSASLAGGGPSTAPVTVTWAGGQPATSTPTNTPVPPTSTSTNTPIPPTSTPVGPTSTFTNTPTRTAVPPTSTPSSGGGGCSTDHVCLTGLTASASSAAPGTQVALTATTAQNVGPTRWYIDIADQSGTVVQSCASGTSCVAYVSSGVAATRTYTAWLSTSSASLAGGGPSTSPVTVTWAGGQPLTSTPTNTPVGPTSTSTNTPVGSTNTPTRTPVVPTSTPVGPTSTPTGTPTAGGGSCSTDHICLTGLTASAASAAPGTQVTLTATTAQSVGPTPWYIDIADQSGTVVQSCASGTSCAVQVSSGVAATRTYIAWLSTSSASLAGGGPSTAPVTVTWAGGQPPTSTPTNTPVGPTSTPTSTPTSGGGCSTDHICLTGLTASAASAAPGTQVALTATTAQSVGPTRWYIDIADQSGTVVQSCASGTSCVAQVSSGVAATRTYTAWLSTSSASLAGGGPSTAPVTVTWH